MAEFGSRGVCICTTHGPPPSAGPGLTDSRDTTPLTYPDGGGLLLMTEFPLVQLQHGVIQSVQHVFILWLAIQNNTVQCSPEPGFRGTWSILSTYLITRHCLRITLGNVLIEHRLHTPLMSHTRLPLLSTLSYWRRLSKQNDTL